jgi:hypothetical protein
MYCLRRGEREEQQQHQHQQRTATAADFRDGMGSPAQLAPLLHVIYRGADTRWRIPVQIFDTFLATKSEGTFAHNSAHISTSPLMVELE